MTENMSQYIESLGIRGVFKQEIFDRHDILLGLMENNGLSSDDIKNRSFGIHYASINIPDAEKRKTLFGMLQSYEEYFSKIKVERNRIITFLPEPEYQMITVLEPQKKTLPKKVHISEMKAFIEEVEREHPDAVDVSVGTVNLTFKIPVRRMEDKKEFVARIVKEDHDYIAKYKDISKKLAEMESLREYME